MERKITIKTDNDEIFKADQAVKSFLKSHGKKLNNDEKKELGGLLRKRAKALSDVMGIRVDSIADDD